MLWHIYLIQTSGLPATLSISSLGYNGVTEELPADYHNLNCYRIVHTTASIPAMYGAPIQASTP